MGFPATSVVRASIVRWAENQPDKPTLSEALRRIVEIGLNMKRPTKDDTENKKARAKELAGSTIDRMSDATASADDNVARKGRLMKGPEEFVEARVDRRKRTSKTIQK